MGDKHLLPASKMVKTPKDKNAPKRNISAFFHFGADCRKKYSKQYSDLGVGDVAKDISNKWNAMAESAKTKFVNIATKDMARYGKEMAKYEKTKNFKDFQTTLAEFKVNKKKADSKFRKDENRPKKAATAWMLFLNDERPKLMKQGLAMTEVTTKASALWKALSGAAKKKYDDKATSDKAKYDKDIAAYEKSGKYKKYMAEKKVFEEGLKADKPKSSSKAKSASKKVKSAGKKAKK